LRNFTVWVQNYLVKHNVAIVIHNVAKAVHQVASLIYYLTLIVEKFTVGPFFQHRVPGRIHFKVTLDSLNVKLGEGEDFGELTAL